MKLPKDKVRCVKCQGCGGLALVILDDVPPHYQKGDVGHAKVDGVVRCALWRRLDKEQFFEAHRNAERVKEEPDLHVLFEN